MPRCTCLTCGYTRAGRVTITTACRFHTYPQRPGRTAAGQCPLTLERCLTTPDIEDLTRGPGTYGDVTHSSRTRGGRRFGVDRFVNRAIGANSAIRATGGTASWYPCR